MDKTNFMNEARRMCSTIGRCDKCPAYDYDLLSCVICFNDEYSSKKKVDIVEKWSKEHPAKTRQSVFLEQWPEGEIDENGCLMLCPLTVSADKRNKHGDCTTLKCTNCRREFWMQEINSIPSSDVSPIIYGRWVLGKCSNCGVDIPTDDSFDIILGRDCHFCYSCGAKMNGGTENA